MEAPRTSTTSSSAIWPIFISAASKVSNIIALGHRNSAYEKPSQKFKVNAWIITDCFGGAGGQECKDSLPQFLARVIN